MSPSRFFWSAASFLLVLTWGVYAGALKNEFVDFDDNVYITQNPHTAAGLVPTSLYYAWTTFDSGNWIPVTWMSYQLDAALFGVNPIAFHGTNVALHAINVVLFFGWLLRWTGFRWQSLITATIFAVHPLHVESVAWAAERKDVLSTFWLLMTLLCYERYASRPTLRMYFATIMCFAVGILSKSMLVTVPLLLLVLDFSCFRRETADNDASALNLIRSELDTTVPDVWNRRSWNRLLLEKIPLFAISILDGIVTIWAQGNGQEGVSAFTSLSRLPLMNRCGNAAQAYCWYVSKSFWPSGLMAYYPHPLDGIDWLSVAIAFLALTVFSVYVAINGRVRHYLVFGWLWFVISLLPVIGLLQVGSQSYADRYSYVPHLGLLPLLVWEFHFWISRLPANRVIAAWVSITVCVVLGLATTIQVRFWRTTDSLWARALDVDPDNWFAHLQIGNRQLLQTNQPEQANIHFQQVIRQRPQHADALNNLGWIHQVRGENDVPQAYYLKALAADPLHGNAMHNLITLMKSQRRLTEITEILKRYCDRRPNDARAHRELGMIYAKSGRMELARTEFSQALTGDPEDQAARNNLALALAHLGQKKEAQEQLKQVLKQNPNDAGAHVNLGVLLQEAGQPGEAGRHYTRALQINPQDNEAAQRLENLSRSARGQN